MEAVPVTPGVTYVRIPEHGLFFLCGCPPDVVKHLMRRGLITERSDRGVSFEIGPNAILLSDVPVQNGGFSNLAEFPILHMFYRQGMILPGHPNNKGTRPLVVGHARAIASVSEALFRGTYGLADEKEVLATGVTPEFAREVIREKQWFSFGSIRSSEELLDLAVIESDPVELRPGLILHREAVNKFVFSSGGTRLKVDLNLEPGQTYEPPFRLGRSQVRREYFSVVHLGEGDGWDTTRPCTGSLLQFQGKNYLIDAGPNILESLEAVGLGITEITGVFQTHAHDDHVAGLPSLAMSDQRLKFYSTRLVRASVMKKMAALMGVPEKIFGTTLEFKDLEPEVWNDVDGLHVRPSWSPHPVETNVYSFRALGESGYKTYTHLADIASFEVLKRVLIESPDATDASKALYSSVTRRFLEPVDLKKVDIGGGMIHGSAEDFAGDKSAKLVMAHLARQPTPREKEIGTFVDFGTQDVLIPARQDYRLRMAEATVTEYFPKAPRWERDLLLNGKLKEYSPGAVLQKKGEYFDRVFLIVGGVVEAVEGETRRECRFSAGTFIGELQILNNQLAAQMWRARSFMTVLEIPKDLYVVFVRKNTDIEEHLNVTQRTFTLQSTALFGDSLSSVNLTRIACGSQALEVKEGQSPQEASGTAAPFLFMVEEGVLSMMYEGKIVASVGPGDSVVKKTSFFRGGGNMSIRALAPTKGLAIPAKLILPVPVLGLKLLETYERRLTSFLEVLAET